MTVYVDNIRTCLPNANWRWNKSCHMFTRCSDNIEQLHTMAAEIGLKRSWFQQHSVVPHYDLTVGKRALAVLHGAVEIDDETMVAMLKEWRNLNGTTT